MQQILSFFKQFHKLIIGTTLAGLLTGAVLYLILPKIYSSTLLLQPSVLTSAEQIKTIDTWNQMREKKDFSELAHQFNCDKAVIKKLRSISAEGVPEGLGSIDKYTSFAVNIRVTDTSVLPGLQKGIIHALENSEYVKDKVAAKKSGFEKLIKITSAEINGYDSLRMAIEKKLSTSNKSSTPVIMDLSDVNYTAIKLHEKLMQLQDSLQFVNAVHVLQNFYKPASSEQPKLPILLLIGGAVGFFLGSAVAFYRYLCKRMKLQGAKERTTL